MSHFTVLVLSKSVEQVDDLLAPYDENTDVTPYWTEGDVNWALDDDQKGLPPEEKIRIYQEKYPEDAVEERYRVVDGRIERQTTYNPDSKWDYWRVGGRWAGNLRLKDGAQGFLAPLSWEWTFPGDEQDAPTEGYVDQAVKADIDIKGMRDEAERKARARWAQFEALFAEHGAWLPWSTLVDNYDRDQAREKYNEQPIVAAAKETLYAGSFFGSLDDEFLGISKEEYVESARLRAVPGYAFLSEQGWEAPGKMGWFGMSTDDVHSRLDYARRVNQVIDDAPDDAVLTIVDCHI
jgi:hypothetical protein